MLIGNKVLIHCGPKTVDIKPLAGITPAFDEVLWQQDSSLFRSQQPISLGQLRDESFKILRRFWLKSDFGE
jgi:hypothetical protein